MNLKTYTSIACFFFITVFSSLSFAETAPTSLEEKRLSRLETTVMNDKLPLEKRVRALRKIIKDEMIDGLVQRTFCIWDPIGKSGPIASAADDQKLRALHYGLDLEFLVFQSEKDIVDEYRNGDRCDSILIRGEVAREFNRFTGTLDALGAVKSVDQFQLLSQVIASPRMAKKMEQDGSTVLGVVYFGGNYALNDDLSKKSIFDFKGQKIAVDSYNGALSELVKAIGSTPVENGFMANTAAYSRGEFNTLFTPLMSYVTMGDKKNSTNILESPLSMSTLQMVGKSDRFPTGMAQLLREDFLFKFFTYVQTVDSEYSNNIPDFAWLGTSRNHDKALEKLLLDIRLKMRDRGYYDGSMLKIQRKVRCKFDPTRAECRNSLE